MRNYRFLRSRHIIEIDLTWKCNLSCFDCNRCISLARSKKNLSVKQIKKFINESNKKGYEWKKIRIAGGEPTLHPQFTEILSLFQEYKYSSNSNLQLLLYTNGNSEKTKNILSELPPNITIMNSNKIQNKPVRHIGHFNMAPKDIRNIKSEDFTLACSQAPYCGMGLTPYGIYHCPVAGTIDRVFRLNLGRKNIPSLHDNMFLEMKNICIYCGFYDMDDRYKIHSNKNTVFLKKAPPISKSWRKAFKAYNSGGKRNKLTKY